MSISTDLKEAILRQDGMYFGLLLIEIVALIVTMNVLDPTVTSFVEYDATIGNSYKGDSTIPYFVAILVPLVSLLISFVALEVLLAKHSCTYSLSKSLSTAIAFFLDFVGTGVVTGILTEVTKNLVGRYRPDWLSRCNPDIVNPVSIDGFGEPASDNPACDTDLSDSKMNDGRKSFPSGHASTAFSLGLFVCGYCLWHVAYQQRQILQSIKKKGSARSYSFIRACIFLWILFQIGWAWGVAISRVMDHKHHESDVTAGALLGSLVCFLFLTKAFITCSEMLDGSESILDSPGHGDDVDLLQSEMMTRSS